MPVDGAYGAGVLPRLRAHKASRASQYHALAGRQVRLRWMTSSRTTTRASADDLGCCITRCGREHGRRRDPTSRAHREALLTTEGMPELAWDYFLIALNHDTAHQHLRSAWLQDFVLRNISAPRSLGVRDHRLMPPHNWKLSTAESPTVGCRNLRWRSCTRPCIVAEYVSNSRGSPSVSVDRAFHLSGL